MAEAALESLKSSKVVPSNKQLVGNLIESNKTKLMAAMPRHLNTDRLLRVMTTAVNSNPKLLQCHTPSLLGAFMTLSQLGLEPNTPMGHAYLLPFRNNKADRTDVQVIIGYKGLIDLARRSGNVTSIAAHAVHEHDTFEFEYGLQEKLRHVPARANRGEVVAFYAVAHMKDGGHAFEVMSVEDVRAIRASTQGRKNDVWDDHFIEMGRKTAIRRLAKYLPMSIELANATELETRREAGDPQHLQTALEGEWSPAEDEPVSLAGFKEVEQPEPEPEPEPAVVKPAKAAAPSAAAADLE